jgi:hypothetical protein
MTIPPAPGTPEPTAAAAAPPLPEPSIAFLVEQFAAQAYLFLGLFPHPTTGKIEKNLPVARHAVDMLALIEEKTQGNLTPEESQFLTSTLYQLRMACIQAAKT